MRYLYLLVLLYSSSVITYAQDVLTNQRVITLVQAHISQDLVLDKIRAGSNQFDLSSQGLIELKQAKIPDSVVEAMMQASLPLTKLSSEDIITLYTGKVSKQVITKRLQYSQTHFNPTDDELIAFKQAKVPDQLVQLLLTPPKKPATESPNKPLPTSPANLPIPDRGRFAEPGLYYESGVDYQQLEATTTNQTRRGTVGEGLLNAYSNARMGGLLNSSSRRAGLANKTSNTIIDKKRPVFYLVLSSESQRDMDQVAESVFSGVGSPNDFVLIKVQTNNRGREIIIGRESTFSSQTGFGAGSIPLRFKKVSPGLYRIYLEKDLPAGEYAFLYNKGSEFTSSLKLFDFSIQQRAK